MKNAKTRTVSEADRGIHVSVRVPRALLERIEAYGQGAGLKRSPAVVLALRHGMAELAKKGEHPIAQGKGGRR